MAVSLTGASRTTTRRWTLRQIVSHHTLTVASLFILITMILLYVRKPSTIYICSHGDSKINIGVESLTDTTRRRYVNEVLTDATEIRAQFQSLIDRHLGASHPDVIHFVKLLLYPPSNHMIKPSLSLQHLNKTFLPRQTKWVMDHFKRKQGGFFVECGGFDGERASNTLMLEQELKWNGVLIEADPFYFTQMLGKSRKCWAINACLSPSKHPQWLTLEEDSGGQGTILFGDMKPGQRVSEVKRTGKNLSLQKSEHPVRNNIPCLPLESILRALNRTSVDYLSLDVEGMEMFILESFPHEDIRIESMTVEYNHAVSDKMAKEDMRQNIISMGYEYVSDINVRNVSLLNWSRDFVFINKQKQ